MITREEILMGRDVAHPLTVEQEINLHELLWRVNMLRRDYGKPMTVTSGYRPAAINKSVGGATKSAHLTCQAVDFADTNGELKHWLTVERLEKYGLYMEHPDATVDWCHLQSRPTKNRIFRP